MTQKPEFQIPDEMTRMAEQNVEQARAAYNQMVEMARQAQDMVMQTQGAALQSALEVQQRAMQFAEKNTEAGFELAGKLAKAKDAQQFIDIQTRHAQSQMQAFNDQAQELGKMLAEAAQKVTKT